MLPERTYWPVNWADGMKISRMHLLANDNAFHDEIRDVAGLLINSFNYGLLPAPVGQDSPLLLTCNGSDLTLSVCRAVTPGGTRIDWSPNRSSPLHLPLGTIREQWQRTGQSQGYVVVDVNPFEPQLWGQPDPGEIPLRYPYTQPTCRLNVIIPSALETGLSAGYHLPIGKLQLAGGNFTLLSDYLPPCRLVSAWPAYRQHHQNITTNLGRIADLATAVIVRVRTSARSGQPNLLASSIGYLAEATVRTIGNQLDSYDLKGLDESPIFTAEVGIRLARTLRLSIKSTPDQERDTMFNYFKNWCNISPADLETSIQQLLEVEYVHSDTLPVIEAINHLTDKLIMLFSKLSELNYVEKGRETIYKEREEVATQPVKRRIWG